MNINFLKYQDQLKVKKDGKQRYIRCLIRSKWLVMQPEELVRQLVILWLINEKNYNVKRISVEKTLKINGLSRRYDILIYDQETRPWLLIECKAPEISISQTTFRQIAWYNMPLQVDYLLVTNGMTTFCCSMNYKEESFHFEAEIPVFP